MIKFVSILPLSFYPACSLTPHLFMTWLVMLFTRRCRSVLGRNELHCCSYIAHTLGYSFIRLLAVTSTYVTPHYCADFMGMLALATGMLWSLWPMLLTFVIALVLCSSLTLLACPHLICILSFSVYWSSYLTVIVRCVAVLFSWCFSVLCCNIFHHFYCYFCTMCTSYYK